MCWMKTETLYKRVNKELVSIERCHPINMMYMELKDMIQEHVAYTQVLQRAKRFLTTSAEYLPKFKKIMPHDYKQYADMPLSRWKKKA